MQLIKSSQIEIPTPAITGIEKPNALNTDQLIQYNALTLKGVPDLSAELCSRRAISNPVDFLHATLEALPNPLSIEGVSRACQLVADLKRSSSPKAFIACDYDADGICSAAIVHSALTSLEIATDLRAPCRQREGYDFNKRLLHEAIQSGAKLLFLLDLGTQQSELVAQARKAGLEVVIIDHHLIAGVESAAPSALINPQEHYSRCAAHLSWKFAQGLIEMFPCVDFKKEQMMGLAALATVADVVPLIEENRVLVRDGIKHILSHPGISALARQVGLSGELTVSDLAFRLAPLINAPGRIVEDGAVLPLKLLTSISEPPEALDAIAREIVGCNSARKKRERLDVALAEKLIGQRPLERAIVVANERFDPGVAGLVAARLVERFHRPAAVIALCEANGGRASVRSAGKFHTYAALRACSKALIRYGGHIAAGGFAIRYDQVGQFTRLFSEQAQVQLGDFHPLTLQAEFAISAKQLAESARELLTEIEPCAPFGNANPTPVWWVPQVKLLRVKEITPLHLLLTFADQHAQFDAYLFNNPHHPIRTEIGKPLDIGVRISRARLHQHGGRSSEMIEFMGIS